MKIMRRCTFPALILMLFASVPVFADDPGSLMLLVEPVQPEIHKPHNTHWKGITSSSARMLSFQHVYRIAMQAKTREYLGGNFFKDYGSSVKGLGGWRDGDNLYTNYVLHPLQGATSGFLFIQNSAGDNEEFGKSSSYWRSRLKALGFAAIYGLQFELGPLSEASIGNVGKRTGTMGFVDLVITPMGGIGWIIAEDAIDRFIVKELEKRLNSTRMICFVRVALNPARSIANVLRFKAPWYRRNRDLNLLAPKKPAREENPADFFPADQEADMDGQESYEAQNFMIFIPA